MYMKGTVLQNQARQLLESEMKKLVVDPAVQDKLVPDFPVGCKRILPSGFPFLKVSPSKSPRMRNRTQPYF
jgi:hypothetical protein